MRCHRLIPVSLFAAALVACNGSPGPSAASHTCGNGIVERDEECDWGLFNAEDGACKLDCTLARCGDGVVGPEEACDDGDANGDLPDACRSDCTLPTCGDGILDAGEQCDAGAGNSIDPNACRPTCELAHCGDGVTDSGETCDLGEANSSAPDAACRPDCTPLRCGDGVTDAGEACDNGSLNGTGPDACRPGCSLPYCGDGIQNSAEECDDGANNGSAPDQCRTNCALPTCGDGIQDTGEACDDHGESTTCNGNCTSLRCGDGILNLTAGEQCDQLTVVTNGWCAPGCHVTCDPGFADCNSDGRDGCEVTPANDELNCGACGHDCGGGACTAGTCGPVELAEVPEVGIFNGFLTADATRLAVNTNGGVAILPLDARAATSPQTLDRVAAIMKAFVLIGDEVYGLQLFPGPVTDYLALGHTPVTTGLPVEISQPGIFAGMAADSSNIYFTTTTSGGSDELKALSLQDLTTSPVSAFRTNTGAGAGDYVAGTTSYLFLSAPSPSELWRVTRPPASPAPTRISATVGGNSPLAADDDFVYVATPTGIVRFPADCAGDAACLSETVADAGTNHLWPVVTDGADVYWLEHGDGRATNVGLHGAATIRRRSAQGAGATETVLDLPNGAVDLLAAGDYLYWVEARSGAPSRVWKLAK